MTDPTITIAGLRAKVSALIDHLETANQSRVNFSCGLSKMEAHAAEVEAERDALAAQLAEVRAKLDAAPKVCAIHSYEHGPGPCMTCGAWPPGTRELIAACQTRIAGLEQAADERSAEVARLTARMAELEARPVLTHEILSAAIKKARKVPPYIARQAADEYMPHLDPVTLPPAQDRADELVSAWRGICTDTATCDLDPAERMRRALASLGAPPTSPPAAIDADALYARCENDFMGGYTGQLYDAFKHGMWTVCNVLRSTKHTSPPAARPVFAGVSLDDLVSAYTDDKCRDHKDGSAEMCCIASGLCAVLARLEVSLVAPEFLRRIPLYTKHGPNGKGGPGPCDAACVKCEAELMAKAAPAREVAPTRVLVHADGGACHGSRVVDGRCVGCGIAPDMQSTSLWLDADARPVQCEPAKVVAPTLVAVSDEELARVSADAYDGSGDNIGAADIAAIRAVLTTETATWLRDKLTAWLDAPRLAARDQLCGVEAIACCYSTGLALIKSKAGEWGVVNTDWLSMASHIGLESTGAQRDWYPTEGEARRAFADDTGKVICESCARFIGHDAATVDSEGIYTCTDESACSAACAAKEQR